MPRSYGVKERSVKNDRSFIGRFGSAGHGYRPPEEVAIVATGPSRVEERQSAGEGRRNTTAVALLCLVQFVDVLGVTVVVTALPSMLAGLHAPASAATLVVTGYAMLFGGLLMLGARLGDRFGH